MKKEMRKIFSSIDKWIEKRKGKAAYVGFFVDFKDNGYDVENMVFDAFGGRQEIKTMHHLMGKEIKKAKGMVINKRTVK